MTDIPARPRGGHPEPEGRMKVVVSGATGFIGSHLVAELERRGYDVTGTVEAGPGVPRPGAKLFLVDIASGRGLEDALRDADAVVHLAARNHVLRERAPDPLAEYRKVNVEGTRNVARAAVRAGARLFVHASSVKAMGEKSDAVLTEESPCAPATPYGISKRESEEAARAELAGSATALAIVRLPMVYGPGNRGNLPRMIRWAQRGLPFPLFTPDNLRSMIYVGNAVAGIVAILEGAGAGPERTYILADRDDYSTRTVYSAVCRALGKTPRFLPIPPWAVRFGAALSDDFRKVAGSFRVSAAKAERELGYSPQFTLEEGMERTVSWCRRSAR